MMSGLITKLVFHSSLVPFSLDGKRNQKDQEKNMLGPHFFSTHPLFPLRGKLEGAYDLLRCEVII